MRLEPPGSRDTPEEKREDRYREPAQADRVFKSDAVEAWEIEHLTRVVRGNGDKIQEHRGTTIEADAKEGNASRGEQIHSVLPDFGPAVHGVNVLQIQPLIDD